MKIIISGVVQGVGFRPAVFRVAKKLGLRGYVLNKGSNVEICIDKEKDKFLELLNEELPSIAKIDDIQVEDDERKFERFKILKSKPGLKCSGIPPDLAICESCLQELFDKTNRRYLYPFTNCTHCGARFSLIKDVPYDREKTAMKEFPLCEECSKEYTDPLSRRFHAQTISCPKCGPKYTLYDKIGSKLNDGIEKFAEYIDQGMIGVIKSWGGMHLVCKIEETKRFRKWYNRPEKPFAVMVRDLSTAKKYAELNEQAEKLLSSDLRPILLLNKKNDSEAISPGLNTVGIYLPYTGLHHILFHYLESSALIMTSANAPNEPMVLNNKDVFSLNADCYLLHNREIINRIDDSVIKMYKDKSFFIRRARGFVPAVFQVPYRENIISLGAERNVTGALSKNGKLYLTQYIGNSRHYGNLRFLEDEINWFINLLALEKIDAIAVDLHPRYTTRRFGEELSLRYNAKIFEIQHHWAHAASLLLDRGIDEIVALTLDGLGYGPDKILWGGEVLVANYENFERVGSLEPIPLIGGDEAIKDPRRVVFGIFEKFGEEIYFEGRASAVFRKVAAKSPVTSSFGRVLDALSCYLGICQSRTYDGEPAMKLEPYLKNGKPTYNFDLEVINGEIKTLSLFEQLKDFANKSLAEREKADLSYSFVSTLLKALVEIGVESAEKNQIPFVGITGGVSYNIPIVELVENFLKATNLKFVTHNKVPNGDGGIAIGQNAIAGYKIK